MGWLPLSVRVVAVWLVFLAPARAGGLLDGNAYAGMIGPVENPDVADTLYFVDGYFWSDACTACGFLPGPYQAKETAAGVRFTGTLQSRSRGRFDYDGLVQADGLITVSIRWERRRWYWTSRREIGFVGQRSLSRNPSLATIRERIQGLVPDENPACARF